jgi:DNA-binding MarR family transcriptional regulator
MVVSVMEPSEAHWQLFALISGIYMKSRRIAEEALRPYNMTWPQFGALLNLLRGDDVTQRELAGKMEADTTTVMVLCNSMERRGWLNRVKDPSDKRVNRLLLTDEGRRVISQAFPLMLSKYQVFTEGITQENMELVLPVLGELYGHINEHYQRERA